jgi:hypothetical protein
MKSKTNRTTGIGVLLTMNLIWVGHGNAAECKPVHAEIISKPYVTGCMSPVKLCTAGTIDGNRGLEGTTSFIGDSIVTPGPSTAPNSQATISYSGRLQITTAKGTLMSIDTGIFDTSTGTPTGGYFASFDVVSGGTLRFAGATGTFQFIGKTVNGQFVSDLRGELCIP